MTGRISTGTAATGELAGIQGKLSASRIERSRGIAAFQQHKAARLAKVGAVGLELERLVDVGQRLDHVLADDRSRQTTVCVGPGHLRIGWIASV